jgi:hypothetical protein
MGITLEQVRAYCRETGMRVFVEESGGMFTGMPGEVPHAVSADMLASFIASSGAQLATPRMLPDTASCYVLRAEGYDELADVLQRAFSQAAFGKGKERHAQGEPFIHQVMQDGARRFGVGALLFQAYKKNEESQRLPLDRAVAEMLGAIVYTAGAVIARERAERAQLAANDNEPTAAANRA